MEKYQPILSCSTLDIYTLKVGLITADEAAHAGASGITANEQYYLNNGQLYWTMSPGNFYVNNPNKDIEMFYVTSRGNLYAYFAANNFGLRPVINLKSDAQISGGNGAKDNPYIVA